MVQPDRAGAVVSIHGWIGISNHRTQRPGGAYEICSLYVTDEDKRGPEELCAQAHSESWRRNSDWNLASWLFCLFVHFRQAIASLFAHLDDGPRGPGKRCIIITENH